MKSGARKEVGRQKKKKKGSSKRKGAGISEGDRLVRSWDGLQTTVPTPEAIEPRLYTLRSRARAVDRDARRTCIPIRLCDQAGAAAGDDGAQMAKTCSQSFSWLSCEVSSPNYRNGVGGKKRKRETNPPRLLLLFLHLSDTAPAFTRSEPPPEKMEGGRGCSGARKEAIRNSVLASDLFRLSIVD